MWPPLAQSGILKNKTKENIDNAGQPYYNEINKTYTPYRYIKI